jgi:hypothetical protein
MPEGADDAFACASLPNRVPRCSTPMAAGKIQDFRACGIDAPGDLDHMFLGSIRYSLLEPCI